MFDTDIYALFSPNMSDDTSFQDASHITVSWVQNSLTLSEALQIVFTM